MHRFIALIVLFTWSGLAVAEKQAFACQYIKAAGLNWEDGGWDTRSFRLGSPFVLVMVGDNLTRDSATSAFGTVYKEGVHCRAVSPQIACTDVSGRFLFFNPETAMGGVARLFGATYSNLPRDPLSVAPFTCQKF